MKKKNDDLIKYSFSIQAPSKIQILNKQESWKVPKTLFDKP